MNLRDPSVAAEAAGNDAEPCGDRGTAGSADAPLGAAFEITPPGAGAPSIPLIFASPHSGRIYPPQMTTASRLDAAAIRRSEDAYVDQLIAGAPAHGVTLLRALFARVFFDVNRQPWELDPAMFEDELPAYARARTARVAAGLGAIARIVSEGQEIYDRKLTFAEARERVEAVHQPYHAALASLIAEARAEHGVAVLVDWHSMPAAAAQQAGLGAGCDMVLGDRFGAACAPALSRQVERELEAMGYRVARNAPYAGGYTTEHYGRPTRRVHALQIEINRALYVDEATLEPTDGFARLQADFDRLAGILAAMEWSAL
ncbi:N-formylglutamate amidohydrolase [Caulobacter sp. KR2-114]|uniref:N-formylglutamate amidohydrolase n=1 Tax=Caulobacter sp. KR2-114 TaxID=3400912 RepID=UPI003BFBD196